MLNRIKSVIIGGINFYYITTNRKYFIKICKGKEEWMAKEYSNLKKYWNKLDVENFQLIEPIKYSKKNEFLATRFIDGKKLANLLEPKIFNEFGKKLKKFHEKGFAHSHLELQDVLYENGKFYLSDVPFFGDWSQLHDLVTIKMSFNMHRLKSPWNWHKYNICCKEFFRGYKLEDSLGFKRDYDYSLNVRMNILLMNGVFNKIKRYIMKLIKKFGLL